MLFYFFKIKYCPISFSQDCRVSRYFTEANSRIDSRKASKQVENSKKNGYLYGCLLPWQQSAIYSYERKRNPRCVANLHCECQELLNLKLKQIVDFQFFILLQVQILLILQGAALTLAQSRDDSADHTEIRLTEITLF